MILEKDQSSNLSHRLTELRIKKSVSKKENDLTAMEGPKVKKYLFGAPENLLLFVLTHKAIVL